MKLTPDTTKIRIANSDDDEFEFDDEFDNEDEEEWRRFQYERSELLKTLNPLETKIYQSIVNALTVSLGPNDLRSLTYASGATKGGLGTD